MTNLCKLLYCCQMLMLAALFLPIKCFAQKEQVQNITFSENDDQIIIHYNLPGDREDQYNIILRLSSDGGKSFAILPKTVTGDINQVKSGTGKTIAWNLYQDYPDGLWGESFVFQIEANRIKKESKKMWPYYLGGASTIGGAAAYFLLSGSKGDEADKNGTLIISVPDMP